MQQYLDLIQTILDNGVDKGDRTGVGTRSIFGHMMRFDLSEGVPLVTTKKVNYRAALIEMLWFLSGSTNVNTLDAKIWDQWATEDGSLGPVYGHQWTRWPTREGGSVNQIDYVINTLKNNPNSRRILFHAWNVEYLPDESVSPQENARNGKMALPPCHLLYQFYVENGKLSLMLTIRSSDVLIGLPFNAVGAYFLMRMIGQQCDMDVGELIISTGDTHIYHNHFEGAREQLTRAPKEKPTLVIKRRPVSIYHYHPDDFEMVGYDPHPAIKLSVAT